MVVLCLCTVQIPSWVRTLTYEASIHINAILNVHIFPYISLWRSNIYSLFSNIYLKILCTNSVFKISMNKKEHMLWIYGPKKIPHENDEWNRKFCAEKTHSPEYTHIVIAWVECSAYCVSKKKNVFNLVRVQAALHHSGNFKVLKDENAWLLWYQRYQFFHCCKDTPYHNLYW